MSGALQRGADQCRAVLAVLGRDAQDDLFVADRQMALQCLTQVADLARALIEHDRLVQKVPFQMLADEIHLGPQQLQQLQTIIAGR